MPKKKNQPKNGFYFFMKDYVVREQIAGRSITMSEAADAVGPQWKNMTAKERQPYEEKAAKGKQEKKNIKYNSLGQSVDELQKREEEIQRKKREMFQNIDDVVTTGNFAQKTFYVAEVNHYCYCYALKKHIPAEISVVRFSLKNGIELKNIYHVIIDTGPMPIGYKLAAMTVSEQSHLIPVPPHEGNLEIISENSLKKIYFSLIDYLRENLTSQDKLPPLYVDDGNMEMAKDIFQHLHDDYDANNVRNEISIYSLSYLFFVLRNAAHLKKEGKKAFPFSSIAQAELEKDIYDSSIEMGCEYHVLTEASVHCSLAKCMRKIYVICDHTCCDLGIQVIPGNHVPSNSKIEFSRSSSGPQIIEAVDSNSSGDQQPDGKTTENTDVKNVENSTEMTDDNTGGKIIENDGKTEKAVPTVKKETVSQNTTRLPNTKSAVLQLPAHPPNYNNDFPALGATTSTNSRPICYGRGRGRLLDNIP